MPVRQLFTSFSIFLLTHGQPNSNFASMATIHDHAEDITLSLGSRIHAMRESREWTLEELAERTDLSKAYLSRLEGGDRQPSIAALAAIAQAFGVSVGALFERPDETAQCVIIRGGSLPIQHANGLVFQPLSGSTKPFNLHSISVTVPADRPGTETYQHDGEEWLHVLSGRLRLVISGEQHVLDPGDSAHFDSRLPHRLDALDGKEARILLVACPIPVTLNRGVETSGIGIEQYAG
jgi:quercetin dioxygenase-like cupin family protein/DNA-binding XRE family transcriptional regulator